MGRPAKLRRLFGAHAHERPDLERTGRVGADPCGSELGAREVAGVHGNRLENGAHTLLGNAGDGFGDLRAGEGHGDDLSLQPAEKVFSDLSRDEIPHTRTELRDGERFVQIVLRALAQQTGAEFLIGDCRQHDDRRRIQCRLLTKLTDQLFAAHEGHRQVRQHEVRPFREGLVVPFAAVEGQGHLEPVGSQAVGDEAAHVRVVLDDEYAPEAPPASNVTRALDEACEARRPVA